MHGKLRSLGVFLFFGMIFMAVVLDPYKCGHNNLPSGGGGGGSGGGGGGGGNPQPTATPTDSARHSRYQQQLGYYSYGSGDTDCWGVSNIKDPITVVMSIEQGTAIRTGQSPSPSHHVYHHGWDVPASNDQNFRKHGSSCVRSDISWATEHASWTDRWHARGLEQSDQNGWGYGSWTVSALTPHYDDAVSCGHAVPQDYDENPANGDYSGFSKARDVLTMLLLDSDHHVGLIDAQNWSNRQAIQQCVTNWSPASDGWVYVFTICDDGVDPNTPDC